MSISHVHGSVSVAGARRPVRIVDDVRDASHGLARTAGNVDHECGLAKAGDMAAERLDQSLRLGQRNPEVCGARRWVELMQIVWRDAGCDAGAEQVSERIAGIVDATQQNRLAHQRNAVGGEAPASRAGVRCQFAGVIGVDGDINLGRAVFQRRCKRCGNVGRDCIGRHHGTRVCQRMT
jgi:hypothetical protein